MNRDWKGFLYQVVYTWIVLYIEVALTEGLSHTKDWAA